MSCPHSSALHVRYLRAGEQAPLRQLRLVALATDPDAFGSTYASDASRPPEWWEEWAAQSEQGTTQRTYLLVDDDDRWLGLALVRLDDDRPGWAQLLAMWISPAARGRRGSLLLCDACAGWARERGAEELRLQVVLDNEVARRAYEAAGFAVRESTTWARDGRTFDVRVMSRRP